MPKNADTEIVPEWQARDMPLPPYRELFRLHTWLTNTVLDWPWDLSEPPSPIRDAEMSISEMVEASCAKEGKTYGEMIRAIHEGQFD